MTTYQPFIYIIGWTELNAWYLGAKWAKGCQPLDLWTTYFTSSQTVAEVREDFGEPDYLETFIIGDGDETRLREARLIAGNRLFEGGRWLNKAFTFFHDEQDPDLLSERAKKQWADPAFKAKMKAIHKARFDDPAMREQRSKQLRAYHDSDRGKAAGAKRSETVRRRYDDPAFRQRASETAKRVAADPAERDRRRERQKALMSDPVYKAEWMEKCRVAREAKKAALSSGLEKED